MSLELAEPRFLLTAGDAAALFEPLFAGCTREKLLVAHVAEDRRLLRLAPDEGGPSHIDLPLRAILADAARLGSAGPSSPIATRAAIRRPAMRISPPPAS